MVHFGKQCPTVQEGANRLRIKEATIRGDMEYFGYLCVETTG